MLRIVFIITALLTFAKAMAQAPQTYKFADRDTCSLYMDIYRPVANSKNTCLIYVFGGGFVTGSRSEPHNVEFYNELVAKGYTVVAIDYRLGLKGQSRVSPFNPAPPFRAVRLATEDLVSATQYIIENAQVLNIDKNRIVLVGSSAGAITVLQTDYELANRSQLVNAIHPDFRYKAVVSLAGALFSTHGKPKYTKQPAPTLMMHGTNDKVVVYNKIQVLNIGMFGTNQLVKIFDKNGFPYMAVRYVDAKHEVAEFPRKYAIQQIINFIDDAVNDKYKNQLDITVRDKFVHDNYKLELQLKDLYRNGN